MFEPDAIQQRGQALENEFFHRVDEKLRAELRASMEHQQLKEQLAVATGFKDSELLDHLVDGGFEATSLTALALVPLVFVAWADGSVTTKERQAVMSAALKRGLDHNPQAMEMFEAWLQKHPPRSLWKLWREYVEAIRESVGPTAAEMLTKELVRQAQIVAEASGGTLGFGKVSKDEQAILDEIAEL